MGDSRAVVGRRAVRRAVAEPFVETMQSHSWRRCRAIRTDDCMDDGRAVRRAVRTAFRTAVRRDGPLVGPMQSRS